jgi:hypothetical protein
MAQLPQDFAAEMGFPIQCSLLTQSENIFKCLLHVLSLAYKYFWRPSLQFILPYSGCLGSQSIEYVVSWLVHLHLNHSLHAGCTLCLVSTTLSLCLKAQCDTMLSFSRLTYAILRAILRLS